MKNEIRIGKQRYNFGAWVVGPAAGAWVRRWETSHEETGRLRLCVTALDTFIFVKEAVQPEREEEALRGAQEEVRAVASDAII